ncbi:hypothetical protein HSR122_2918 [Halapricum desulfuricans]|uniref:Uncharacterized protein n=1 Tax=Halapricum desulfuricans TaxID=2841257 RepID=A0A897NCS7_9EURY|nr:hypothetical protein HSR122_2918 [Halapricum desulfuricans]
MFQVDTAGCNKLKEFATRGGEYLYELTAGSMTIDQAERATA